MSIGENLGTSIYENVGVQGIVIEQAPPDTTIPDIYKPTTLTFIHWSVPVRAYPDIDLDFKITGYDWYDRTLTWSLDSSPGGMTIDSATGVISWTPRRIPDSGNHSITVRMTPSGGTAITKTFSLDVVDGQGNFVFMATTGNDSTGDGSEGSPYATLSRCLDDVGASDEKTILIRGGTYTGQNTGTPQAPIGGVDGREINPIYIASYPGESAVFDANNTQHGIILFDQYVVFDKLEIKNCTGADDGGLFLWRNSAGKRCTVHDCNWSESANVAGVYMGSDTLADSCTSYDNYDSTSGENAYWNSSNYIYYGDKSSGTEAFCIDCLSGGIDQTESPVGFKIKHSGSGGPIHYHRCVSRYSRYAYMTCGDYSSLNNCIGLGDRSGNYLANGEGTGYVENGMLIYNSTMITDVSASENGGIYTSGKWMFQTTTFNEGLRVQSCNIITQATAGASGGAPLVHGTYYTYGSPDFVGNVDYRIKDNVIYAPADASIMEMGNGNFLTVSGVNAEGSNSGNTYGGVAPATLTVTSGGGVNLTQTTWTWDKSTGTLTQA